MQKWYRIIGAGRNIVKESCVIAIIFFIKYIITYKIFMKAIFDFTNKNINDSHMVSFCSETRSTV